MRNLVKFIAGPPSTQRGSALLAFMMLLIVGTSYLLVSKLNANVVIARGNLETREALNLAKQTLIGYAATYPEHHPGEGPGFLPCPDRDNNGVTDPGACALSTASSIGRFPYKTLETQNIRDRHGERIWYVVSDYFRNNPKRVPLNSDTAGGSGNLTVNGVSDIAAVLFAPGAPVEGQNRNTAGINNYVNYIDAAFSADNKTITTGSSANYLLLTKDELMKVVEKRVLGEVSSVLKNHKNTYNAYPWLTPFADPKSTASVLGGVHDGTDNSSSLSDSTKNFLTMGIAVGDLVRNVSDGSISTVSTVAATTLSLSGLSLGKENDFDTNDGYVIYHSLYRANAVATGGSNNLVLADSSVNFKNLGVSVGDVVEDLTDGSSGVIESVAANELNVRALSGGINNTFSGGDTYQIRSSLGRVTAAGGLTLNDANKNFNTLGIRSGDLVVNYTDGSFGRISAVTGPTALLVDNLNFGADNTFDVNDYYYIPRFNTNNSAREGLLSFHDTDENFSTGFSFDWNITQANGAQRTTTVNTPGPDANYLTALRSHVEGALGTVTINNNDDDGECVWSDEDTVDCKGTALDNFLQGSTSAGSNSVFVTDASRNFNTYGVKAGDIVLNYDDTDEDSPNRTGTADAGSGVLLLVDKGYDFSALDPSGLYKYVFIKNGDLNTIAVAAEFLDGPNAGQKNTVRLIPSPVDADLTFSAGDTWQARVPQEVIVASVPSNNVLYTVRTSSNAPDLDADEYYRVLTATGRLSGVVDSSDFTGTFLRDWSADFSNVQVGDIIQNTSDGAFGVITSIPSTTSLYARLYLPTNPTSSTTRSFNSGENYVIHYDHVGARRYAVNTRYTAVPRVYEQSKVKKRDVCIGYVDAGNNPDCSPTATRQATSLPANNNVATVTITDFLRDSSVTAATATITIDGTTSGSMKTSRLAYYLERADGDGDGDNDELPGWFFNNKWHQLVYIAYNGGDAPDAVAACTAGTDCLILESSTTPNDNKKAIAIIAGDETQTTLDNTCDPVAAFTQNRTSGQLNDYFEEENCSSGDDQFRNKNLSSSFNDHVRIIEQP